MEELINKLKLISIKEAEVCADPDQISALYNLPPFSSCQLSSHCPSSHICCPNSDGRRHCFSSNTSSPLTTAQTLQLETTCRQIPGDLQESAGADCSAHPSVCSGGAVCCQGVCHGLPSMATITTDGCLPGTFVCNITGGIGQSRIMLTTDTGK